MLKLTKKIEYSLIALKFMTDKTPGELTSAREICNEFKTPFDTMAKVLQAMNTSGLLSSVKGIKGGYYLEKDLSTISFIDLCTIIEKNYIQNTCQSGPKGCDLYGLCNIKTPISNLNNSVFNFLKGLSLKKLLEDTQVILGPMDVNYKEEGI